MQLPVIGLIGSGLLDIRVIVPFLVPPSPIPLIFAI